MKKKKAALPEPAAPPQRRAFADVTTKPCPICLKLAAEGQIQGRSVMPLPTFPALSRQDNRSPCCRDCQATETMMALGLQHPNFGPARLTIANERCEGMTMPLGMMEHFGLCQMGYILPCSIDDMQAHFQWLESQGIPDNASCEPFEMPRHLVPLPLPKRPRRRH